MTDTLKPPESTFPAHQITIPDNVFVPDAWTTVFAEGIRQYLKKQRYPVDVLEIGTGSGIVPIEILNNGNAGRISGFTVTDIVPGVPELAKQNIDRIHPQISSKIRARLSDLLTNVEPGILQKTDVVVACIPQVPLPPGKNIKEDDNFAHYYDPKVYRSKWNDRGLGLIDNTLAQVRELTYSNVILNVSGRIDIREATRLFHERGFTPEVTCKRIIPQHPGTRLDFYKDAERNGIQTEFFADSDGNQVISAKEAEKRRGDRQAVYHHLYVLAGTRQ